MPYPNEPPRWRRYLRFIRPDIRGDVDEELRFHVESRIAELVALGVPIGVARARALDEFGDIDATRHGLVAIDHRVARRRGHIEWWSDVAADASYAARSLRRTPGVALAILLTLALGVGANASMFTVLDTIFLRAPAGVAAPEGIRRLWSEQRFRDGPQFSQILSYVQFDAVRSAIGNRGQIAAYRLPTKTQIGRGENAGSAEVSYANAAYFSLLGVRASLGRIYSTDEDRLDAPAPVVVLSHAYWERAFDGNPNAIGQSIIIDGTTFTIVGVAAKTFAGTELDAADAWAPLSFYARGRDGSATWWKDPRVNGLFALLRPADGANERELERRITVALRRPQVSDSQDDSLTVARFGSIVAANGPGTKSQEEQIAVRLAGVAAIVLMIACANVVNLLLARAIRRRREIAVRLALGIAKGRLIRLLLAESLVLASGATAIALLVAYWGGALLRRLLMPDVHWAQSPLDGRVVGFALAVSIGAGLIAGLIPALQSANPELTSALKLGAGSGVAQHSRLRAFLVIAQSALSVLLLIGAVLFVRSLANVRGIDIGFDARRLVTATVRFDDHPRSSDPTLEPRLAEVAERVSRLNGVEQVALASIPPMAGFSTLDYFTDADPGGSNPRFFATVTAVSPGYFGAAGIRILRGDDFPRATASSMTYDVIVNDAMAKRLWPGRNAIGQCMRFLKRTEPCYRVLGIVENSRRGRILEKETAAQYYLPLGNIPSPGRNYLRGYYIAFRIGPERYGAIGNEVRALIRQQFPGGIPVLTRLSDYIEPEYRPWRLGAFLFTGFGILALSIAVIGIYSTVSYGVNQRIHEFGVRIALGATLSNILKIVVAESVRTVAIGIALGVALAIIAGRLIASLLYGVVPSDPVVIASVAGVLLAVGALAALGPAWKAARVDPVSALRTD
jgi:putative ABC transport system permease protein